MHHHTPNLHLQFFRICCLCAIRKEDLKCTNSVIVTQLSVQRLCHGPHPYLLKFLSPNSPAIFVSFVKVSKPKSKNWPVGKTHSENPLQRNTAELLRLFKANCVVFLYPLRLNHFSLLYMSRTLQSNTMSL